MSCLYSQYIASSIAFLPAHSTAANASCIPPSSGDIQRLASSVLAARRLSECSCSVIRVCLVNVTHGKSTQITLPTTDVFGRPLLSTQFAHYTLESCRLVQLHPCELLSPFWVKAGQTNDGENA